MFERVINNSEQEYSEKQLTRRYTGAISESDSRRAPGFKDIRCRRLPTPPDTAIPMAESRFEEPLLCLDIESRIKGCGSTCDVTEARDGIQTLGRLATVMRCGAKW